MNAKILPSLAMLKTNWDHLGRDYIENFVPLVAECLRLNQSDVVALADLQDSLVKEFGLDLPQNVVKSILNRARKRELVRVENHVFYRNPDELAKLQFKTVRDDLLKRYESVLDKFVAYVRDNHTDACQRDDAEAWLHQYFEENGLLVLRAMALGETLPQPKRRSSSPIYFAGAFIRHLAENEEGTFAFFEQVVQGDMLANAIFLREPSASARKFRNTSVYLDTSFLLYSLGYTGEPRRAPCKELLDLLYEAGADLKCFRHTLDEARGVLTACATRLARNDLKHSFGPSIDYFIEQGYSASDVELFCVRLERDIGNLRVKIVDKPVYDDHDFVIDEQQLSEDLSLKIGYRNRQALLRDVDSVAAVMRLRRGREYFAIEDCRAVFVTPNIGLARVSKQFFYEDASPGAIPPCVTDHALTVLLWLKSPDKAPQLPHKRLIAACYAATEPDEAFWRNFLAQIDRLQESGDLSSDEYYLLRHSLRVKDLLMELTGGKESAFTAGTVTEILEVVRGRVEEGARKDASEQRHLREQAEAQVRALRDRSDAIFARVSLRAQRFAGYCAKAIEGTILLALVLGAAFSFPWDLPDPQAASARYAASMIQALVLLLTVLNLWRGVTVKNLLREAELRLSAWIEGKLRTLVYPGSKK